MIPTLLITRPEPQATELVRQIRAATDQPFHLVSSPLIEFRPTDAVVDFADNEAAIFTSGNGIRLASFRKTRPGMRAWCVGAQTAKTAHEAGFDPVSADGDASDLVKLILEEDDPGPLVHVRGAETRGKILEKLTKAGLCCREVVVYRQTYPKLNAAAIDRLGTIGDVIAPIFSPKTAEALLNQGPFNADVQVIAISEAVVSACGPELSHGARLAAHPDQQSMVAAICTALGGK